MNCTVTPLDIDSFFGIYPKNLLKGWIAEGKLLRTPAKLQELVTNTIIKDKRTIVLAHKNLPPALKSEVRRKMEEVIRNKGPGAWLQPCFICKEIEKKSSCQLCDQRKDWGKIVNTVEEGLKMVKRRRRIVRMVKRNHHGKENLFNDL